MGGETSEVASAWTVDSLRDTILLLIGEKDQRIMERDRRYEQRFVAQEAAIETAMTAYGTAVGLAAQKHAEEMVEIRRHFDSILLERDVRYGERFEASQVAIQAALNEREKATHTALLEREKAVTLALASLRDFYDTVMAERNTRYDQRFADAEKAVVVALATVDKEFAERIRQVRDETMLAMQAAEKAISKAEIATEKRFDAVNEFRAQQTDIIATFARKSEVDTRLLGLSEKVDGLTSACTSLAGSALPRTEYDRASADLNARLTTIEKGFAEKIETQAKAFESRILLLQQQVSAVEAVTR